MLWQSTHTFMMHSLTRSRMLIVTGDAHVTRRTGHSVLWKIPDFNSDARVHSPPPPTHTPPNPLTHIRTHSYLIPIRLTRTHIIPHTCIHTHHVYCFSEPTERTRHHDHPPTHTHTRTHTSLQPTHSLQRAAAIASPRARHPRPPLPLPPRRRNPPRHRY